MLFLLIRLAFLEFLTVIALKNVIAPNTLRSFWFQRGLGSHFCLVFYSSRKNILELLLFTFSFAIFLSFWVSFSKMAFISRPHILPLYHWFYFSTVLPSNWVSTCQSKQQPCYHCRLWPALFSPHVFFFWTERPEPCLWVFKLKKQRLIDVEIWGWV